jgi:putative flippase GtrA
MTLIPRGLRFAAVGFMCYLIQLGLVHVLHGVVTLYLADVLAFLISAQVNFTLSQLFTWRDRRDTESLPVRFVKFNANALVSVTIVNATVFWLLVQTGLSLWAAMLLANVATACWTFLINHFFVFRAEQEQKSESLEETDMTVLPIAAQVPSIALFMPAFNEADNLDGVVGRAYEFFDGMGISERAVIVVNDGSTDSTPTALADIASRHPIEVVTHETNRGYGRALRSGFEAALATGHEWIAYCDSDGQFDPADLAMLMVAAHSHRVNVVLGVRVKRADNLARRAAGRGWHGVSRLVLKYDASDVDCGFKLLHRTAVATVAAELQSDYAAISPELLARLCRAGHRMVEVPVPHYPRVNGKQSGLDPKVVLRSFGDLYAVRRELGMDRALRAEAQRTAHYLPVAGQEAI